MYLEQRAAEDALFAKKYRNPAKNIDDCVTYIASMGWILFMQKKGLWQQLIHAATGCEKLFFTLGGLVLMMSLHIFSIHANHLRLFPQ